jgi:hypothetical protein
MSKRRPKPRLDREMLAPALKAAFDVATGDNESFDAQLRKLDDRA